MSRRRCVRRRGDGEDRPEGGSPLSIASEEGDTAPGGGPAAGMEINSVRAGDRGAIVI